MLVPTSQHDQDQLLKLRVGSEYKARITKARNPKHHRKGFALLNMIFENQDKYATLEDLRTELKLLTGWYDHHVRLNGEVIYKPKSMSFADMDQTQFEEWYDRTLTLAAQHFNLPEQTVEFLAESDQ